jgi:formamidopyrimidine-DNA glycosylase
MPELPEVETICRTLREGQPGLPSLLGEMITGVQVLWPRTLANCTPDEFVERLVGHTIGTIGRRGKFLLFNLSTDTLIIHLRMSGDLLVEVVSSPSGTSAAYSQHHRLIFDLRDGLRLSFNDPRKFGRAWLVGDPLQVLGSLGPEPLDPLFTVDDLYQRLQAYHRQLKPLLMDQNFLAGLGNIYTDEALHLARLHPLMSSHEVTRTEAERLWLSIREVLQEGLRRQGASIDWVYRGGDFQNYFRVYQRTGEPCPVCGTPIQRLVVGQRGTHICPVCQVLRG